MSRRAGRCSWGCSASVGDPVQACVRHSGNGSGSLVASLPSCADSACTGPTPETRTSTLSPSDVRACGARFEPAGGTRATRKLSRSGVLTRTITGCAIARAHHPYPGCPPDPRHVPSCDIVGSQKHLLPRPPPENRLSGIPSSMIDRTVLRCEAVPVLLGTPCGRARNSVTVESVGDCAVAFPFKCSAKIRRMTAAVSSSTARMRRRESCAGWMRPGVDHDVVVWRGHLVGVPR